MEKENVYCGVDLHYGKSVFCFVDEKGNVKDQKEINTNKEDIEELLGRCRDFRINYAFEAGGMARYFYKIVQGMDNTERIHVVHPYKFKVITESKNKNDKEDSKKLAKALQKDYLPYPVYIKSDKSRYLQILLGLRKRMVLTRAKIMNQTKSIMRSLGVKPTTRSLKSDRGFGKLIELLKEHGVEQAIVKGLHEEFNVETRKIEAIEDRIKELIITDNKLKNNYELLTTIPGIGFIGAATILSVIDNVSRFNTAGEYSSYCGLVPSEHSSGNKVVHGRITKEGPTNLRTLYIQAAWSIMRRRNNAGNLRLNKLRKKFYRISIKEKNAQRAIVAVARHLSRITFGVLKHQKEYCGDNLEENKTQAC
jgi:transposase